MLCPRTNVNISYILIFLKTPLPSTKIFLYTNSIFTQLCLQSNATTTQKLFLSNGKVEEGCGQSTTADMPLDVLRGASGTGTRNWKPGTAAFSGVFEGTSELYTGRWRAGENFFSCSTLSSYVGPRDPQSPFVPCGPLECLTLILDKLPEVPQQTHFVFKVFPKPHETRASFVKDLTGQYVVYVFSTRQGVVLFGQNLQCRRGAAWRTAFRFLWESQTERNRTNMSC